MAQVVARAICHSDIYWIRGEWGGETPMVVGGEAAGIIWEEAYILPPTKPGVGVELDEEVAARHPSPRGGAASTASASLVARSCTIQLSMI